MEFRLLVEGTNSSSPNLGFRFNGKQWQVTEPLPLGEDTVPPFVCISYTWGHGREQNPVYTRELMSTHTRPALSAAMRHCSTKAFWIDALCVPSSPPHKLATLGSMGFIYSEASEVVICMSESLAPVIREMRSSDRISDAALLALENDGWVRSVWTYQEVVNSKLLNFVSGAEVVDGSQFLNCLGYSLQHYKAAHDIDDMDLSKTLPRLDALEELIADWMTGNYTERSALRTMSQFAYRYNEDPKNYFYAFLGAVVRGPWPWNPAMSVEELASEFMDICEEKNDYSFIYASNPRSETAGHGWRPEPGLLRAPVIWHTYGAGQKGHRDAQGLWLEDIVLVVPTAQIGRVGKRFLMQWLNRSRRHHVEGSDAEIVATLLDDLRRMAYNGSRQQILTDIGVFFPQTPIDELDSVEILLSTGTRWSFGAAGLAKVGTGDYIHYVPGVFIGELRKSVSRDVLLSDLSTTVK